MIYVIAKLPCHEEGASKFTEWAKGDDGFSVTRSHKGFKTPDLITKSPPRRVKITVVIQPKVFE